MAALSRLLFKRLLHFDFFFFLHITVWGFSFCLLCSSCCVALPHVASPPCRHFWSKQVWSCRGYEPKLGPLPPSLKTSLRKVGFEKERPADLPPVPGGARRCHVSWKEKIKLFVMRFRAKGFRDQRAVKLQEGEQWPNQMHAVPQPVGKMQRDCLRQKGPRWECGVNDSSKDPWSWKVVWKGVAGTTARRKYETGTSYKKAEGEASRSSWSAPAAPATSPRAITDVIEKKEYEF